MKKKNNILTIVLLIAIAILLVTVIVSVFNFSPNMKEYTYGEMVDAFEQNKIYGYIKDPNEFSVILFLSAEDWVNYWDGDTKNDKTLYENLRVANLASSDYYEFFGSPYSSYEPSMLSSIQNELEASGIKSNLENRYESKEVKETPWYVSNLPLIIMVVLFIVFMIISFRQANGGKMSSFGKSKARHGESSKERVTFADVAGADEEKEELKEIYTANQSLQVNTQMY